MLRDEARADAIRDMLRDEARGGELGAGPEVQSLRPSLDRVGVWFRVVLLLLLAVAWIAVPLRID